MVFLTAYLETVLKVIGVWNLLKRSGKKVMLAESGNQLGVPTVLRFVVKVLEIDSLTSLTYLLVIYPLHLYRDE